MDSENDSVVVVVNRCDKLVIKGVEYSRYCQRAEKPQANAICEDLINLGCKSVIRRDNGCFSVWWARS